MGSDPVGKFLGPSGLGIGVITGSQCGYENLNLFHFARYSFHHVHRHSGVIHKGLFAGLVDLSHDRIQSLGPGMVEITKTAVLVSLGMGLQVFLPQKVERHALALELLAEVFKI